MEVQSKIVVFSEGFDSGKQNHECLCNVSVFLILKGEKELKFLGQDKEDINKTIRGSRTIFPKDLERLGKDD